VAITRGGYIKRMPTTEYRVQGRGGVGLKAGTERDDDDQVIELVEASSHAWVLLFTNTGRVFRKRVFEFPLGTRGQRPKALVNFLELKEGEQVLEMVAYLEDEVDENNYVVLASREGYIKRTALSEFANIRTTGLIAATVAEGDGLVDAKLTNGKCDIIMASRDGQSIRFDEEQVRPMGRTARGVKGMGLRKGDEVVTMLIHDRSESEDENFFLTVCENGYGKRTPASEYGAQNRSGLGLKAIKVSKRNGKVVGMVKVREADQLMVVTTGGKIIRTRVSGISVLGRATQGVRLIKLSEGETVSSLACIDEAQAAEGEDELVEAPEGEDEGEGEGDDESDDEGEGDDSEDGDESEDEA
jgi:DNA gyrase subunit A